MAPRVIIVWVAISGPQRGKEACCEGGSTYVWLTGLYSLRALRNYPKSAEYSCSSILLPGCNIRFVGLLGHGIVRRVKFSVYLEIVSLGERGTELLRKKEPKKQIGAALCTIARVSTLVELQSRLGHKQLIF